MKNTEKSVNIFWTFCVLEYVAYVLFVEAISLWLLKFRAKYTHITDTKLVLNVQNYKLSKGETWNFSQQKINI